MESGEREIKQAFEEVQVRNINSVITFVETSRKMTLEQQEKIDALNARVMAQEALLNQFRVQLAGLQTKIYSGGSM